MPDKPAATAPIEDTTRRAARNKIALAFQLLIGKPGISIEDQVAHTAKARQLVKEAHLLLGETLAIKTQKMQQALLETDLFADLEDSMPSVAELVEKFNAEETAKIELTVDDEIDPNTDDGF